jgi:hypothetical protein
MDTIITIHDQDFNIVSANEEAKKILKLPSLGIANVKCYKCYHGKDSVPELCPCIKCFINGKPIVFKIFEPHLNMNLQVKAVPLFDYMYNPIGLLHVVKNITKLN